MQNDTSPAPCGGTLPKKVCPQCGREFLTGSKKRIYCCRKCAQAACARRAYRAKAGDPEQRRENVCLYNEGVDCAGGECSKCGWNPAVAKARLDGKQVAGCFE